MASKASGGRAASGAVLRPDRTEAQHVPGVEPVALRAQLLNQRSATFRAHADECALAGTILARIRR